MSIYVDVQYASLNPNLPEKDMITTWVDAVLNKQGETGELTVRIVDETEGRELNEKWRKAIGATNVLSFPADERVKDTSDLLGDIIICAPIVEHEAKRQNKPLLAHWAHMVIHGSLHLLDFDHINKDDAEIMEALEIKILSELGITNPYLGGVTK